MSLEQLALDVEELTRRGGLLDQLRDLLPEQPVDPGVGSKQHHKVSGSPDPRHGEAAAVLDTIHAGARQLERELREHVTGHPGQPRGGSDRNTRDALDAVVNLAYAAPDEEVQHAARKAASWCRAAREVGDIDQQEQWRVLPRRPGELPPRCPYCGLYSLRWTRERGIVRCLTNPGCRDHDGDRPSARMEIGTYSQQALLVFRDGMTVSYTAQESTA